MINTQRKTANRSRNCRPFSFPDFDTRQDAAPDTQQRQNKCFEIVQGIALYRGGVDAKTVKICTFLFIAFFQFSTLLIFKYLHFFYSVQICTDQIFFALFCTDRAKSLHCICTAYPFGSANFLKTVQMQCRCFPVNALFSANLFTFCTFFFSFN